MVFYYSGGESSAQSKGSVDTGCSTDYIWIPNGYASTQFTSAISQQDVAPDSEESTWANRFCGRYLTTSNTEYTGVSVCSYATPFVLGVNFDNNEICASGSKYPGGNALECEGIGGAEEEANENGGAGQLGFSLCYVQHTPPI